MSLGIDKLSNAFAKSILQTSTLSPFSYALLQSFKHSNSLVPVECCYKKKTCCCLDNKFFDVKCFSKTSFIKASIALHAIEVNAIGL